MPAPLWKQEHPKALVDIDQGFLNTLIDQSYSHDCCPIFIKPLLGTTAHVLLIHMDYINLCYREHPEEKCARFSVSLTVKEGDGYDSSAGLWHIKDCDTVEDLKFALDSFDGVNDVNKVLGQ